MGAINASPFTGAAESTPLDIDLHALSERPFVPTELDLFSNHPGPMIGEGSDLRRMLEHSARQSTLLKRLGGHVERAGMADGEIVALHIHGHPKPAQISTLGEFENLLHLGLREIRLTQADVECIARIPTLRVVEIDRSPLEHLDLSSWGLSESLTSLSFSRCDLTSSRFDWVPTTVASIRLADCRVGRDALRRIVARSMDRLSLENTLESEEDLAELNVATAIHRVHFQATALSTEGAKYLARIPEIEEIDLGTTKVSDKALLVLARIPTLTRITLDCSDTTAEAIQLAKALNPHLILRSPYSLSLKLADAEDLRTDRPGSAGGLLDPPETDWFLARQPTDIALGVAWELVSAQQESESRAPRLITNTPFFSGE
jgi:hypothetical protein